MAEIGCNANRIERTQRDIRLDDADHYVAVFQTSGRSISLQNDRTVHLAGGNVTLIDTARPVTYVVENGYGRWRTLKLPRQAVVSRLGFEPSGGAAACEETHAGRLLFNILDWIADEEKVMPASANTYMELAVYDLLGALFAPSVQPSISVHTDRIFRRICEIVNGRFSDPTFCPSEIAAELGISQRYLQKLFTARGLVCSRFIQSVRLDHAARLLHGRTELDTSRPLSEIAYACGFNDYGHFSRRFRQRFGRSPGTKGQRIDNVVTGNAHISAA
jgi:AraC family transcriptional activator of tynA and feaB